MNRSERPVYEAFLAQVRSRLDRGRIDFQDRSLERPSPELVTEIQEELADVCGWAALLWTRLERLRGPVAELERASAENAQDSAETLAVPRS